MPAKKKSYCQIQLYTVYRSVVHRETEGEGLVPPLLLDLLDQ